LRFPSAIGKCHASEQVHRPAVPTRQLVVWSLFYGRCITAGIRSNILPNDTVNRWKEELNNIYWLPQSDSNISPCSYRTCNSVWSLLIYIFVLSGLLSGSLVAGGSNLSCAWPGHAMLVSCACLCSSATALLWWVFADQKEPAGWPRRLCKLIRSPVAGSEPFQIPKFAGLIYYFDIAAYPMLPQQLLTAANFPCLDLELKRGTHSWCCQSAEHSAAACSCCSALCVLVCSKEPRYVALYSFKRAVRWSVPQPDALPANCHLPVARQPVRSLAVDSGLHSTSRSASQRARMIPSITMNNSLIRSLLEPCLAIWTAAVIGCPGCDLSRGRFGCGLESVCSGLSAVRARPSRLRLVLSDEHAQRQMAVAAGSGRSACGSGRLGTVAIGSLVIAVTRLPRWALSWFSQAKACGGLGRLLRQMSPIKQIRFGCRCAHRRAVLVRGCRRRLGSAFWPTARLAALRRRSILPGDFVLLTAKLAVSAACTIVCTVLLNVEYGRTKSIRFFPLPIVLVATFAFLVAHCFLSVFENLVFDTCDGYDAATCLLAASAIRHRRRQAAAATMRLSELEDLDQMEDVPDIALQPQGRPDSSLPMRRMQAPTATS
uniref:Choline transporter-like protein n=1 Tax=Macrostomum lignano TaxID=282301 RepID=A0A1I8FAU2_9PLAT